MSTWASGLRKHILNSDSLARLLSQALDRPVHFEEVLQLAEAGQPAARALIKEAGHGLGRLLAAICNLTMPERIIIAGEGARLAVAAHDVGDAGS